MHVATLSILLLGISAPNPGAKPDKITSNQRLLERALREVIPDQGQEQSGAQIAKGFESLRSDPLTKREVDVGPNFATLTLTNRATGHVQAVHLLSRGKGVDVFAGSGTGPDHMAWEGRFADGTHYRGTDDSAGDPGAGAFTRTAKSSLEKSGLEKSGEEKSGEEKSGEEKGGEAKSGEAKSEFLLEVNRSASGKMDLRERQVSYGVDGLPRTTEWVGRVGNDELQ